ncbi:MAG TPA: hypothetical protein VMY42_12615 [Thermoguttaceae bacterium]|nr:hypothetical protein [Thermoguttaceae bacterium]
MAEEKRDKHHRKKKSREQPSFFRRYWFEISVSALFALGVFLLAERMQIKATILAGFTWLLRGVYNGVIALENAVVGIYGDFEMSDIVGTLLILAALGMVAYRMRARAIASHPDLEEDCPQCGGNLQRIRCDRPHRILGAILRVHMKHYSCRACTFQSFAWIRKSEHKWQKGS